MPSNHRNLVNRGTLRVHFASLLQAIPIKDYVLKRRVHATGIEALPCQHPDRWRIQINLREPNGYPGTLTGYKATTVEMAKALAEKEIIRHGHRCNGSCKDWTEF